MGCRGCLFVFAVGLLIIVGLSGTAYHLATEPSAIVAEMVLVSPSADAALAFDSKVGTFNNDVLSTSPFDDSPTVMLELTEEEATSKFVELLEVRQLPVKMINPLVNFRNGRMQASVDLDLSGVTINLAVETRVEAYEGKPDAMIERVDVGRIALPELIRQPIIDAIATGADPLKLSDLSYDIESISLADGLFRMNSSKRPK